MDRSQTHPVEPARDQPIIRFVPRRLHVPRLSLGEIPLDPAQSHHAREVLRLAEGTIVEVFDNDGQVATGAIRFNGPRDTLVHVARLETPQPTSGSRIIVASAVPKGERADWMVEKLSELGVWAFIPLAAERSVVLPEGKGKRQRWMRIATESAKQSKRPGVMRIEELTPLKTVVDQYPGALALSTREAALSVIKAVSARPPDQELAFLIGPEGGWTHSEISGFENDGIAQVRLTNTILRIETAAIATASIAATLLAR